MTTTRADALGIAANPEPLLGWSMVVLGGLTALVCVAPTLLVLAGFVGVVPFDMNMLFVALPALAVAVALATVGRGVLSDLLLPRPVLSVGADGIFDRRVMAQPLPWSDVIRATSVIDGGGGVVLDLHHPIPTVGMGSLAFEQPDPGVAHIAVRGMTVPTEALAGGILELASAAGVEAGRARSHEKLRRRTWSI